MALWARCFLFIGLFAPYAQANNCNTLFNKHIIRGFVHGTYVLENLPTLKNYEISILLPQSKNMIHKDNPVQVILARYRGPFSNETLSNTDAWFSKKQLQPIKQTSNTDPLFAELQIAVSHLLSLPADAPLQIIAYRYKEDAR